MDRHLDGLPPAMLATPLGLVVQLSNLIRLVLRDRAHL
jgi:hypothetical protein